jgi:predicted nucleic acid-binding protein
MNCTIDASVFVAASRPEELQYEVSRRFLTELRKQAANVFCPVLVLPEAAGAIIRRIGYTEITDELIALIEEFPGMNLTPLTLSLARRAAQIATAQQLRGADAVYVAVAEEFNAFLVAWDAEMLARGAAVVSTTTPQVWLDNQIDNLEVG